jgi:hypothetical protein
METDGHTLSPHCAFILYALCKEDTMITLLSSLASFHSTLSCICTSLLVHYINLYHMATEDLNACITEPLARLLTHDLTL